jgi:hypothetical protein
VLLLKGVRYIHAKKAPAAVATVSTALILTAVAVWKASHIDVWIMLANKAISWSARRVVKQESSGVWEGFLEQ